jgi:YggT family protein
MLVLINAINILFEIYLIMLFIRVIGSWVPELSEYKLMRFNSYYTDPYLNFFRKFIPPLGMIDISPIVAFLCLGFIQRIVIALLVSFVR